MRLQFPLIPIVIHIQFESRPWRVSWPRLSIRWLILVIAVLAVLMGTYMTAIVMPEQRQRFLLAEQRIDRQVKLLQSAAEAAILADREIEELVVRDRASIEKEEQEARKWPESSEEHALHLRLATRRRSELAKVTKQLGSWARFAEGYQKRATEILEARKKASNSLFEIEQLALQAEKSPETPLWNTGNLAQNRAALMARRKINQSPRPRGNRLASL
jgi:hypothetical protein